MSCIEIDGLTKDYGGGRGIFDVSLVVEKGEVFGFAGINGAGKTTTIRHLMGFLRPESGRCSINGRDCWREAAQVKRLVAYVPGEIEFPADRTGTEFLRHQLELAGHGGAERAHELCRRLQLDETAPLRSMSKGMKQKTALVAAFALDPEVLVMDEPTTGLDPLMRDVFLELVEEQRAAGHTVFMSSHIFSEMEDVCDRVALIREGRIATQVKMDELRHPKTKTFEVVLAEPDDLVRIGTELAPYVASRDEASLSVTLHVPDAETDTLVAALSQAHVRSFVEHRRTLDDCLRSAFEESRRPHASRDHLAGSPHVMFPTH